MSNPTKAAHCEKFGAYHDCSDPAPISELQDLLDEGKILQRTVSVVLTETW